MPCCTSQRGRHRCVRNTPVLARKATTATISVVFVVAIDPAAAGLVAHPIADTAFLGASWATPTVNSKTGCPWSTHQPSGGPDPS